MKLLGLTTTALVSAGTLLLAASGYAQSEGQRTSALNSRGEWVQGVYCNVSGRMVAFPVESAPCLKGGASSGSPARPRGPTAAELAAVAAERRRAEEAQAARLRAEAEARAVRAREAEANRQFQLEKSEALNSLKGSGGVNYDGELKGSVNTEGSLLGLKERAGNDRSGMRDSALKLGKDFEQLQAQHAATIAARMQRLARSINSINVPSPRVPQRYRRILIYGMNSTQEEADEDCKKETNPDPFSGEKFDECFAFGEAGVKDLFRAGLDHMLGVFGKLSPQTSSRLGHLRGSTADEVVCHSNGCRVAIVLIKTGQLKTKKLRMLGADNALLELDDLATLRRQRGLEEVSVFAIKHDVVPIIGAAAWNIVDLMKAIGRPIDYFAHKKSDPTYQILGLVEKPPFNPYADVKVHVLLAPASRSAPNPEQRPVPNSDPFQKHLYENYYRAVRGWKRSDCLKPEGAKEKKCTTY